MSIFSHQSRSSFKSTRLARVAKGFTLMELLVVMSIMLVVTTFMLFKQSKFDSSTILRSLAYSIALSMRQAQVYGTSVLGTQTNSATCGSGSYSVTTGTCFASAYGLYFDSASPTGYILFADYNNNGKYDSGEDVKAFSLGTGYTISQLCAMASVQRCTPATISSLSVVFKRPNPDAQITALDGNGNPISGDIYSSATIQIQNLGDVTSTRTITVTTTGLISAQ